MPQRRARAGATGSAIVPPPDRRRCCRAPPGPGWLPPQILEHSREIDRVLAAPTRNLQHQAALGQNAAQHRKDRLAIARDRGCGERAWRKRRHCLTVTWHSLLLVELHLSLAEPD